MSKGVRCMYAKYCKSEFERKSTLNSGQTKICIRIQKQRKYLMNLHYLKT